MEAFKNAFKKEEVTRVAQSFEVNDGDNRPYFDTNLCSDRDGINRFL